MSDNLFLLGADNILKRMPLSRFKSEDVFQQLLAKHTDLLTNADAGDESPRRLILVQREASVPIAEQGAGYFAVDHLFLDQDGVPTLVEVKRADDTRARREVVAQMLDYAANAVSFWRIDDLIKAYHRTCDLESVDPVARMAELLETEALDIEAFWKTVQSNLGDRRIRMIFVADRLSPELERIVEFLNEQMKSATVLALELRPFQKDTDLILSPRLVGATTRAAAQKNVYSRGAPSIEEWLSRSSAPTSSKKFIELMTELGAVCKPAGKAVAIEAPPEGLRVTYLRQGGNASIATYMLKNHSSAFVSDASRADLLAKFEHLSFKLASRNVNGEPSFTLPDVGESKKWDLLQKFYEDLFTAISKSVSENQ